MTRDYDQGLRHRAWRWKTTLTPWAAPSLLVDWRSGAGLLDGPRADPGPRLIHRSGVRLARAGLADLAPPRAVVLLLYTHPPTRERIRMAEGFSTRRGATQ